MYKDFQIRQLKKNYKKILKKLKYLKIKAMYPKWHLKAGYCQLRLNDKDEAYFHFKKALKLGRELDQLDTIAMSQYYLGIYFYEEKNLTQSEKYFSEAYQNFIILKISNKNIDQAKCFILLCLYLGNIYNNHKSFDLAIEIFNSGTELIDKLIETMGKQENNYKFFRKMHSLLNLQIGDCFAKEDMIDKALNSLKQVDYKYLEDYDINMWVNLFAILLKHRNQTEDAIYVLKNIKKYFIEKSNIMMQIENRSKIERLLSYISIIDENLMRFENKKEKE